MIRNYIIIAWRNLLRNKFISLINIGGLAIGISTFMIIAIYVSYELSYDDFIQKRDNIFRVNLTWVSPYSSGGSTLTDAVTKQVLRPISGVSKVARLHHHLSGPASGMVSFYDDKIDEKSSFEEYGIYKAEQEFIDLFQIPFLFGNPKTALKEIYLVAISRKTAIKYFGECSNKIIGKTIYIDQVEDAVNTSFTISGIFEDLPDNSHMKFDLLISYITYATILPELYEFRNVYPHFHCYIELNDPSSFKRIERDLQNAMDSVYAARGKMSIDDYRTPDINASYNKISLHSLSSLNLNSTTNKEMKEHSNSLYLSILGGIALVILLIAWINYINLSLVQVMRRNKETGVRKLIGADRLSMVTQFLIESLNANLVAIMISITIISITIPTLSEFVGKPLNMAIWSLGKPSLMWFTAIFGFVFAISTVVTGLYPAIVYSSVAPSTILKGVSSGRMGNAHGRNKIRSFLIFMQYASVYILIAVTIGFYLQIQYLQNSDLGFDGGQVLTIRTPMKEQADFDKIEYLKNVLKSENFVQNISMSSSVPGKNISFNTFLRGTQQDSLKSSCKFISADENFLDLYGIKIIAGRNISKDHENYQNSILISKRTLANLGYTNPEEILGEELRLGLGLTTSAFTSRSVVGVFEDYHHYTPKSNEWDIAILQEGGYLAREENGKMVIRQSFHNFDRSYLSLKINSVNMRESLKQIETQWKQVFPGYQIDHFFQDDMYNRQYQADLKFGAIFMLFTIISISLACLGLLGICLFLINQRTKEIGIRKILGASIANLFGLMLYRFIGLILVAGLFGIPITWYVLNKLLQEFANRIELSWWLFAIPLVLILFIALLTIGGNTLRKVNTNPVEALRYE
jgi:putative ABC transport system permease protein